MTTLTGITSQPVQSSFATLENGALVSIYMSYRPQQQGWFADISWSDWSVNGVRLCAAPNILRQWQNRVPFGLALLTFNNSEPLNQNAFSSGFARLILLNPADVTSVNVLTYSGN
jgi:hypothetical protein